MYQALVSHSQASAARQVSRADIEKRIHQTVGGITDHSEEAAVTTLQHLLSTIRRAELPGQETLACCRMLAGEMQELSRAYRGKLGAFAPEEDAPTEEYYRQMHAYLHAAVGRSSPISTTASASTAAAKKYVGEHYMDSTLSLDGTAAQLGISPSYLSRIFSEVDGKRFTQYLSDLAHRAGQAPAGGRKQAGARRRAGGRLPDRPELHAGLQVQDRRDPQ